MPKPVTLTLPHELGADEAKRRIADGFGRMIRQLPGGAMMQLSESWSGDRMSFTAKALGQTVSGYVDVRPAEVVLEVVLPELLAAIADNFRGKIKSAGQLLLQKR